MIITGDFNSRSFIWGDIEANPRGKIVEDWMLSNNLHCLNDTEKFIPTFDGHRGSSVTDLTFVTEDILNKINIEIPGNETLSDHRLVLISYNQNRGNTTLTSKVEVSLPRY